MRQILNSMKNAGIKALPLNPEEREPAPPTANTIVGLFGLVDRGTAFEDGT